MHCTVVMSLQVSHVPSLACIEAREQIVLLLICIA